MGATGTTSPDPDRILHALGDPVRRRLLDELRAGERSVGDLAGSLAIAQPNVSKHLKVLLAAGLVQVRPEAQRRWYGLRVEPLLALYAWLAPYRSLWDGALDDLERHLDQLEDRR